MTGKGAVPGGQPPVPEKKRVPSRAEMREQYRAAVLEGRVLAAVRAVAPESSTLTGSVQAHKVLNDKGKEVVRVMRMEVWEITPEQWQEITERLYLDTPEDVKGA